jgi:hypothetical protein
MQRLINPNDIKEWRHALLVISHSGQAQSTLHQGNSFYYHIAGTDERGLALR